VREAYHGGEHDGKVHLPRKKGAAEEGGTGRHRTGLLACTRPVIKLLISQPTHAFTSGPVLKLENCANSRYLYSVAKTSDIGILGGGQLARMLILSAHPLGLRPQVFAATAHDPAAQVIARPFLGALGDKADLRRFLSPLASATFESEFVDTKKLQQSLPQTLNLFPSLKVIEQIQDRRPQKHLLDRFSIPASPWMEIRNFNDLKLAERKFPRGFVLKARRFGYDGYGTFICQKADAKILRKSEFGFIAEELIEFKRELAISFVRSRRGAIVDLPLVESLQKDSRCFSVHGPVEHPGLKSLSQSFHKLMHEIDYVGALAVELFDTGKTLLVNELAPRVHNSAHYSQDALTCGQFEYHLRAGLDLPLPKVELRAPGFAMVNLLGEGGKVKLSYSPGGFLHWYGKKENRPGRKLGHINVLDKTPALALRRALKWRKEFQL
jgi:5-(carboxyamino)imidazole ribonucleotide synthase